MLVENALFATLEPTTRRGQFDDGRPFVLTDTVGFVRHLPTQLVEAFRSTLEEVVDADLLVHVVDGSDVNPLAQINAVRQVVNDVVAEYDIVAPPELLVVNKTDAASGLTLAQLRRALPDAVFVSAHTGDGLDQLRSRMAELVVPTDTTVDVTIPYDRGDLVARDAFRRPGGRHRTHRATAPGSRRGCRSRWPRVWPGSLPPDDHWRLVCAHRWQWAGELLDLHQYVRAGAALGQRRRPDVVGQHVRIAVHAHARPGRPGPPGRTTRPSTAAPRRGRSAVVDAPRRPGTRRGR